MLEVKERDAMRHRARLGADASSKDVIALLDEQESTPQGEQIARLQTIVDEALLVVQRLECARTTDSGVRSLGHNIRAYQRWQIMQDVGTRELRE